MGVGLDICSLQQGSGMPLQPCWRRAGQKGVEITILIVLVLWRSLSLVLYHQLLAEVP